MIGTIIGIIVGIIALRFLYVLFRPVWNWDTEDTSKYRVRAKPSDDYVYMEYSCNGGQDWKSIKCCDSPVFGGERYTTRSLFYRIGNGNFAAELQQFSTYERVKKYEEREFERIRKGNDSLDEDERQREAAKKATLRRIQEENQKYAGNK